MGFKRYEELICWQLSEELARRVHLILERPHVARDFRWRDEIADATSSSSRNMAEGFKRRSRGEFARFLDFSVSSLGEVQSLLDHALMRHHISTGEHAELKFLAIRASIAASRLAATQRRFARERKRTRT